MFFYFGFNVCNIPQFLVKVIVIVFLCLDLRLEKKQLNTVKLESYASSRILHWTVQRDSCEQNGDDTRAFLGGTQIIQTWGDGDPNQGRGCKDKEDLVESRNILSDPQNLVIAQLLWGLEGFAG